MDLNSRQPAVALPERGLLSRGEAMVLAQVRQAGMLSRTDLQEQLQLSRAIAASLVNQLLERGILVEIGAGDSEGGRPPRLFGINGTVGYVAGVDVGATSLDIALADFNNRIVQRHSEPANVRDGPELLLGRITHLLTGMLARQGGHVEQVLAIGIGVPGPVRFDEGVLVAPPLMPGWEGFPIRALLRRHFPRANVVIDNDVNMMALGEAAQGRGRGVPNFLFIKIGTGIGCGIIINAEPYRGRDGAAGDVGHICIDYNGPICHCGNAGCLEVMAGGPAIARRGKEAAQNGQSDFLAQRLAENGGTLTAGDVGEAAHAGDRVANEIVRSTGQMIGGMLATLVNFFNPELISIGGGVSQMGNRLLAAIHQAVLRRSTALSTRHLRVEFSQLGADAGVVGALWLALEHAFEVEP